jgi:hypothetical protein
LVERSDTILRCTRISYRTRARAVNSHGGCAALKAESKLRTGINTEASLKHMIRTHYKST